ncbi:MAG: 2-polyprenylphenol 6-hydroxylase [Thermodesulfobacteriota bacterium]
MQIKSYKNIRRLHQIITVLIKYGFGGLVKEMKLFPYIAVFERILFFKKARSKRELSIPQRIRMVLEELGPTFVKLGQVVSIRADLLPPDWVEEFKKLQDMVPPSPIEEIKQVVEKSFKAPISTIFSTFDEVPVASASIAQVHYATLADGTTVAVKVKRPGIDGVIEADISVLYTVARLLDKYVPQAKRYRTVEVVDEFSRTIRKEQDFMVEGGNINRFQKIFEGDPTIQIPKVYWGCTTHEVLTLERIYGVPIDETDKIKELGLDVKKIAENSIKAFFKQVFEFGVFHADLHPGNIFARDDGTIIYLDFGIIGRLDHKLRRYLASMLFYLVKQDYYRMAMIHREMNLISREVDMHEFEDALRDITEPIFGRRLEEIDIPDLLMKLLQTARRFKMKLQPNLLLLQKSIVIIEGVGRQLYPDSNMWEVVRPLIYRWMIKEKMSPGKILKRKREKAEGLIDVVANAPFQLNTLLNRILEDDVKVGFVHHKLDTLTKEIDNLGQRVAIALIIASLVIGSALVVVSSVKNISGFSIIPFVSLGAFLLTIGFGLGFLISLRRPGKKGE